MQTNLKSHKRRILVISLLLFFSTPAFAERSFIIADDIDAAPYISGDSHQRPVGIFFDTVKAAFERLNINLNYQVHPWTRAQKLVETRQADALITIPTPKRLAFLEPSKEPIFTMRYKIFTQRGNPKISQIKSVRKLADLNGLKIIDYLGDGWARKNLGKFDLYWAPSLSAACKMLSARRGDVFLQDEMMVWHAIKKIKETSAYWRTKFNNIVSYDAPVAQIGFHLLIRKDSQFVTILPGFDETLRQMQKDGEINAIKNKWLPQ